MTDRVLCRYFLHGNCKYGENCRFAHDLRTPACQVCKYFLQGNCSYGDKCRYEHVRPEWAKAKQQKPATNYSPPQVPKPSLGPSPSSSFDNEVSEDQEKHEGANYYGNHSQGYVQENTEANSYDSATFWLGDSGTSNGYGLENLQVHDYETTCTLPSAWQGRTTGLSNKNKPLCAQFQVSGHCTRGDNCPLVHGNHCQMCGRYALHPYDKKAVAEHRKECKERQSRLQAQSLSADIECSICLEKVLSKELPSQRKFGLLSCAHPFCLSCIRSWRAKQDAQLDTDQALRTCPVCRTPSHFVTPSIVWPTDAEAKERIINNYKTKLMSIDCKYYNYGEGSCPFGTSCFYRHVDRDGNPEEVVLRKAGTADGTVEVLQPVRLSQFLENDQAMRLLRARR